MRIAVFEVESWERERLESLREQHDVKINPQPLRAKNAAEFADTQVVATFIYSELSAATLDQMPDVRLITTRSTGVDHIDLDYCNERGIVVCNVPIYGENTVAEHVFALLLTISHKTFDAIDRTRKGDFSLQGLRGFDLAGRTLGVVGTGAIGQHVIRIAKGFQMRVLAYDLNPREDVARELDFEYADFETVLRSADVLTLHVPGTPKTRHMISHDEIALMKDNVVIINTARGALVDVQALMRGFADGKIYAAGLDVLPEEPTVREEAELLYSIFRRQHDLETLLANHVLLRMRNVYITPHSAFCTQEAVQRILDVTFENIAAFERGEPQNTVGSVASTQSQSG